MVHVYYTNLADFISEENLVKLTCFPKEFGVKWSGISSHKQRVQSQLSKILLVDAFKALGLSLEELMSYQVSEMGKPDIDSDNYFSISHSDDVVVVAVSESPIGVDVQSRVTKSDNVLGRVCSLVELEFFSSKEKLWTRKEAVVKLFGDSIMNGKKYDVSQDDNTAYQISSFELENEMSCSIALEKDKVIGNVNVNFIQY